MTECICTVHCQFFNDKMADMPEMAVLLKKRYCIEDNSECARYAVFEKLGEDAVPDDLFPNETYRAERLLAAV